MAAVHARYNVGENPFGGQIDLAFRIHYSRAQAAQGAQDSGLTLQNKLAVGNVVPCGFNLFKDVGHFRDRARW